MSDAFFRALARDAASHYRTAGRFAHHFAYGKLTGDPAFAHILRGGLVPAEARVLDLGCGQGVLAALLLAARAARSQGAWPERWPPPADPARLTGIDLVERDVERARRACPDGRFIAGDIRTTGFDPADAVVILDVLHYMDYAAQTGVLQRVRDALGKGGVLLLRVGDESPTLRFRITVAVDRLVMWLRGHRFDRLHCKPLAAWTAELEALGFSVATAPMSAGTPFANVLLVARYHPR